MTIKRTLLLIPFACIVLTVALRAQDVSKVGTTSAKFLSIPVGSRAMGMGSSFASVTNDASALYWNPAGATRTAGSDFMVSQTQWIAELRHTYTGIVVNDKELGAFGFSVVSLTMPDMDVTTESYPEGTGEQFSASSYAIGISYARNLTEWFSIGFTGKYIQEGIYNSHASAFAVDVGTLFTTPFYGTRLGVSITNFGNKMQMMGSDLLVQKDIDEMQNGNNGKIDAYLGTEKFDLPLNLRISLSGEVIDVEDHRLTIAVDATHPNDNMESFSAGAEYSLMSGLLTLRAGRQYLTDYDQEYAFGAGTQYYLTPSIGFKFDYAYSSMGRLKNIQTFTVGLTF